ncbi:MAG TPA: HipA family kinase [Xanthomonadales bacterium]|nr:HipA family kinase [Xanthomonadales bacterium]
MRTIHATRYVTPLREGGSLPAVVEGDDEGLYVLKFRGAGQGAKALVAEAVAGGIARALGLPLPEIVLAELDGDLARNEPDPEIQALIRASAGLNLALDFLPGAVAFDPAVETPDAALASAIVWFDAFVMNVDRTPRNTNLLVWHRRLMLIDHGASLYFHHDFERAERAVAEPFARIREHVLLPFATKLADVDAGLAAKLDASALRSIVAEVPAAWLGDDADAVRARYVDILVRRLAARAFVEEAVRARPGHL